MRTRLFAILNALANPVVSIGGAVLLGAGAVALAWYLTVSAPSGTYTRAVFGTVTEETDVPATVKAAHSTSLSFQVPGRVAAIRVEVGDHVAAGQTLVALDAGSTAAALAGAKAGLEVQQAKLSALQTGTRPEQLSITTTAAAQAQNALLDSARSAFIYSDDAVHAKADQAFTNPRTTSALLLVQVSDAELVTRVQNERIALEPLLTAWQTSITTAGNDPAGVATRAEENLKKVSTFLDDLATALAETPAGGATSATTLSGYQTSVNTARVNVSAALTALTAAITANKAAAGALVLAQAGATAQDLAAQQAQVDAAAAAVAAAEVALSNTVIAAPVSGTITEQNADLGETVAPGVPLVSIIADGAFQADAQVSEADIAKVKLGDTVQASFDAYPGTSFDARVTTVGPAATVVNGVSGYPVTVTFTANDPRLKPGLSANLRIITATKDHALSVPTSALITSGTEKFVYVKRGSNTVKTAVTSGLVGSTITEVTSGLSEGDEVLTFGSTAP